MKIVWSDFSIKMLKEIHKYHKENVSIQVANRIKSKIFSATKLLLKNPDSGQIELSLEPLNEAHRFIVEGNYKVVYKKVIEGILITDVFDCRQDPIKINDDKRLPNY